MWLVIAFIYIEHKGAAYFFSGLQFFKELLELLCKIYQISLVHGNSC